MLGSAYVTELRGQMAITAPGGHGPQPPSPFASVATKVSSFHCLKPSYPLCKTRRVEIKGYLVHPTANSP